MICRRFSEAENGPEGPEIPIYHFESSNENPITWGRFMDLSSKHGILTPSVKAIWYYCITLQKSYTLYLLSVILMHYLPAVFVDGVLLCIGKSPR